MDLALTVAPGEVQAALERFLTSGDEGLEAAVARDHHALPLYSDFMGCFALRPSGEVIFVAWDEPSEASAVQLGLPDYKVIHVARVRGGLRYPEIAGIMPVRPLDARTCHSCHGSGQASHPEFLCECGGLGWVPWSEGAA